MTPRYSRGRQLRPGPSWDQPAGRVGKERLERELGGSEQRSIFAEHAGNDADEPAWSGQGASIQLVLESRSHERKDPSEDPAEHDEPRVEDVDETGQADAEPATAMIERAQGCRHAGLRLAQHRVDLRAATPGRAAGDPQQRGFADLGLPASERPAAAGRAGRVDGHVADLAAVPGDAGQGAAVDDQAATDAVLARDEQDIITSDCRAPAELHEGAEVGIIRDRDRGVEAEGRFERLAQRSVAPAEVRGQRYDAVTAPDDADDGDAHADRPLGRWP